MNRKIIALLLLVSLCFSIVACTGSETPDNNDGPANTPSTSDKVLYEIPDGGYDGSSVTITFSHTMNQDLRSILDRYIKDFNKIYPNIKVEHSQVGGYDELHEQINKQIAGNNQPNIAYCYADHVALYNASKKVVPLDAFIDSTIEVQTATGTAVLGYTDAEKQDLIDGGYYYEGTVFDEAGTMYTLPILRSTEVMFYNKTVFEDEALLAKYPDLKVPTTWEEMERVCEILKTEYPECTPLGYDSESNWFITLCEQYGSNYTSSVKGEEYLFNNKTNKDFVKMLRSWYEKGYFTTKALNGDAYTSDIFTQTADEGKAFMCIGSSGGAKNQFPESLDGVAPFEIGVAQIPQVDTSKPKSISQGPSLCIFESDNKQEVIASWLFVKFLTTNKEYQAEASMVQGYMPVLKSVRDIDSYKAYLASADSDTLNHVTASAVKLGLELVDSYYVSPAFSGSAKARVQVGKIITICMEQPAADAAALDELVNKVFNEAIYACLH